MPRYDGTGPRGLGPKTGRKLGPCSTRQVPVKKESLLTLLLALINIKRK